MADPAPRDPAPPREVTCPLPRHNDERITLAHGGGGKRTTELIETVFLPRLDPARRGPLADAARLSLATGTLAMTTDSYVVRPLFFPGGSIGHLAVNGTVNDLAMIGARPKYLSVGFVLEEGCPIEQLERIVDDMAAAAEQAGVRIVTGDTKVVQRGHGDGCYLNTSGVGELPAERHIGPERARPGDAVLLSGTLGDHGMAIMSVREGLEFEAEIRSDTAPLAGLIERLLDVEPDIHVLRDPTRGGLSATLNEIAKDSGCGIEIDQSQIPIRTPVRSACEILGLDPLQVANEGKFVCLAPAGSTPRLLEAMRGDPRGREAARIGRVVAEHPGIVVSRTELGTARVVPPPSGEQLPRIC